MCCPDMWQEIYDLYSDENGGPVAEVDDDTCPFCNMPLVLCDCLDD